MQTLTLTITLPDIIRFDEHAALQMQVVYIKSLIDAGKIDFNDPAQRTAVLEWYLRVVPHLQPTAEENEAAKAELWQGLGWPTPEPSESLEDLRQAIRADLARLDNYNESKQRASNSSLVQPQPTGQPRSAPSQSVA